MTSKFAPRSRLPIDESNQQQLILQFDKSLVLFFQNSLSKQREMIQYEFLQHDYLQRVNQYKFMSQARPKKIKLNSNILLLREYDQLSGEYSEFTIYLRKSLSNQVPSLTPQQERIYQFLKELDTNLQKLKYLFLTNEENNIVLNGSTAQYASSLRNILGENPYYFQKIQTDILQIILETIFDKQVRIVESIISSSSNGGSSGISQSGSYGSRRNKIRVPRQQQQRNEGSIQSSSQSSQSKESQSVSSYSLIDYINNAYIDFSRAIDNQHPLETFTRKILYKYEAKGEGDQLIAQKLRELNIQRQIENVKYVQSLQDLKYMVKYRVQYNQLSRVHSTSNNVEEPPKHCVSYSCEKGNSQFQFLSNDRQILAKVTKTQIYNFIMSVFQGIKELQANRIIHPDLQLPNFIKIKEYFKIIDYKKIICPHDEDQHMKNIYREIFKLLLQLQNFEALRVQFNELVNDPKYETIYNQYKQQKIHISLVSRLRSQTGNRILMSHQSINFRYQINNPQIQQQINPQQQAIKSFFKVLYQDMQLKHYSQFYTLIVDKLLKQGKNKTGFPLSQKQIQSIIQLFPSIEDVVQDPHLIGRFKDHFKALVLKIQAANEPRINRKQNRQQQFLRNISHESINEQQHKRNIRLKTHLLTQLGQQFINQYCYIQRQQSTEGALPARYKKIKYIELFQRPLNTYQYIISVVDILQQLQQNGMVLLHADEKTFIFDGTKHRLATLQFVYKIKAISQQQDKKKLQNEAIDQSYQTIRHAVLLLNSESKIPFLSFAEKINSQYNFNLQTVRRIGNKNLRNFHAELIYRIFSLIYCLADSIILQGNEENYQKLNIIKAIVQICTKTNSNNCYDIKRRIQTSNVFQTVENR